jgi:hypothetical protein
MYPMPREVQRSPEEQACLGWLDCHAEADLPGLYCEGRRNARDHGAWARWKTAADLSIRGESMNTQTKILAGGFVLFLASGFINQVFKTTWMLYVGCGAFAVPLLLFVVLPMVFMPTEGARRDAKASMHQYAKEAGLEPYTKAELKQLEEAERYNYNANARSGAFWAQSKTYVDYDSHVRDVLTGHRVR